MEDSGRIEFGEIKVKKFLKRKLSTKEATTKVAPYKIQEKSNYLIASFKVLPALKAGTFIEGIEMRCDGLRGFTPIREARCETRNVPNPVMVTELPFFNSFVTRVVSASSAAPAERFVMPAASAIALMISCLDMGKRGNVSRI